MRKSCPSMNHFTSRTGTTEETFPKGFQRQWQGRKGWLAEWRDPKAFTAPASLAMSCFQYTAHAPRRMPQAGKWSWGGVMMVIFVIVHQHELCILWGPCGTWGAFWHSPMPSTLSPFPPSPASRWYSLAFWLHFTWASLQVTGFPLDSRSPAV